MYALAVAAAEGFLSTPSARRATCFYANPYWRQTNFYPRPPRGGRRHHQNPRRSHNYFYPRPPRGGRPTDGYRRGISFCISIHALREEGDAKVSGQSHLDALFLSTPSARRATCPAALPQHHLPISIHALREEGDLSIMGSGQGAKKFLSTPSARRATA